MAHAVKSLAPAWLDYRAYSMDFLNDKGFLAWRCQKEYEGLKCALCSGGMVQQNDGHIIIISLRTTKSSHFSARWGETEMSEGAGSYDFSGRWGVSVCHPLQAPRRKGQEAKRGGSAQPRAQSTRHEFLLVQISMGLLD